MDEAAEAYDPGEKIDMAEGPEDQVARFRAEEAMSSRRVGYILGAMIVLGLLMLGLFSIRYEELHADQGSRGGSASVRYPQ